MIGRWLLITSALTLAWSCGADHSVQAIDRGLVQRVPAPVQKLRTTPRQASDETCIVMVGPFIDRRRRTATLGEVDGQTVKARDVAKWLRIAFENQLESNADINVTHSDFGGRGVRIDAEVLSAYVVDDRGELVANVVMRLNYSTPDGGLQTKLAYGSSTRNDRHGRRDWHVVDDMFESALSDLVAKSRNNLEDLCTIAPG